MVYPYPAVSRHDGNGSAIQNKPKEEAETDLVKLAEACTEKTTDILSQLTEEQLNREIDLTASFGRKVTGAALFQLAMEHEIHHVCLLNNPTIFIRLYMIKRR